MAYYRRRTRKADDGARLDRAQPGRRASFARVIGESPAMQAVFNLIEKVAPTHSNVLVYGESGTEKSWLPMPFMMRVSGQIALSFPWIVFPFRRPA